MSTTESARTLARSSAPTALLSQQTWLLGSLLVCCMVLQRFGVPFGSDRQLNITGPLCVGLMVYGLVFGILNIDFRRALVFGAMLFFVLIGQMHVMASRPAYGGAYSIISLEQWLAITSFTLVVFRQPRPESDYFRIVNLGFAILAGCGILQFFAQFAGIQIFSFKGILPDNILAEGIWNLVIPFGVGDLYKSNSFWLVEPSVTSQFMALALAIEFLYFRRPLYFLLLGLNLILAFSGTGEIVLASFMLGLMVRLGRRGLVLGMTMLIAFAALAAVAVLVVPDMADVVAARSQEIYTPGSSGFDRFVTPFWYMSDVITNYPYTLLLGIGAGVSEHILMPYEFDVNTPIKILIEYGLPTMLCYVALFLTGHRTMRQSVLVLPCFIMLMVTGAYQQFAPIVVLLSLLVCTPNLIQEAEP